MAYRIASLAVACLLVTVVARFPCVGEGRAATPRRPPPRRRRDAVRTEFIRFTDDGKGGGTLDTAIATYRNADGVEVDLVAALHVGEASYYKGLSETFDGYDALLYELVKPKDGPVPGSRVAVRPARGGERAAGAAAVGGIQSLMKNALQARVSARGDQLRPAQLRPRRPRRRDVQRDAGAARRVDARADAPLGRARDEAPARGQGRAAPITSFDLLAAMASPDSARQYKLLLARQFRDLEDKISGVEGEQGSVLISERNKAALRVLKQRIAWGERKLGVFYGAGHMPGIERALVDEMGFKLHGGGMARCVGHAGAGGEGEAERVEGGMMVRFSRRGGCWNEEKAVSLGAHRLLVWLTRLWRAARTAGKPAR